MKRCMKKRVAILLAAVTLITSSGMSSLAATFKGTLKGERGNDYYLVNLNAGQEEFTNPYNYVATESNGTSSNALVEQEGPSKTTTFAVNSTETLNLSKVKQAASNAGLKDNSERIWLKNENDLSSQIQSNDIVSVTDGMTLYAGLLKSAEIKTTDPALKGLSVTSFGGDGVALTVADIKSEDKLNNLADLKKAIDGKYTGASFDDILQMDIEPSSEYKGGKVVIRIRLPYTFTSKVKAGKRIIALHKKADGNWEVRNVKHLENNSNEYEFDLDSFSPVVLAVVDNPETVNVTLENVPGAIGAIYSGDWGDRTYLPIGETVPVPVGTELQLGGWTDTGNSIIFNIQIGDKTEKKESGYRYIVEDGKDVIITPVEKDNSNDDDDSYPSIYIGYRKNPRQLKPAKVTADLYLQYGRNEVEATNWRLLKVGEKGTDDSNYEFDYTKEDQYQNEKFTLTGSKLSSNEELPLGFYELLIACDYDGKTYVREKTITIGVRVYYNLLLAKPEVNTEDDYLWTEISLSISDYYSAGEKTFGVITGEKEEHLPKIKFFGDKYEHVGWMKSNGDEIKGDTIVNENMNVYALFKDKEGNPYKLPTVGKASDTNKPSTTAPSRGSSSTRGSNSSSSSSTTVSNSGTSSSRNLVGTWKRDAKGWWFQLSSGGYQKNNWGVLNGSWYYFDADGYMKTGWIQYNDAWYYTNPESGADEGKMQTGWIYDSSLGRWFYLGRTGMMETGWVQVNGVWYYLNPVSDGTRGAMAANTWIGNYYVGANGAWDQSRTR